MVKLSLLLYLTCQLLLPSKDWITDPNGSISLCVAETSRIDIKIENNSNTTHRVTLIGIPGNSPWIQKIDPNDQVGFLRIPPKISQDTNPFSEVDKKEQSYFLNIKIEYAHTPFDEKDTVWIPCRIVFGGSTQSNTFLERIIRSDMGADKHPNKNDVRWNDLVVTLQNENIDSEPCEKLEEGEKEADEDLH